MKLNHGLGVVHCSSCYGACRRVAGDSWWSSLRVALLCRWRNFRA